WAAAGLVVVGGVVAAVVLAALASGSKGPQRFAVPASVPNIDEYFDEDATWAAVVETTVPAAAEQVWQRLSAGGYFGAVPFITGPQIIGLDMSYRAVLIALSERVVRHNPARELV
ncbi:SRPBCC family protein, partial [Mycobacteroides abscessus subsp. abscessus]